MSEDQRQDRNVTGVTCVDFKAYEKNSLKGFCALRIELPANLGPSAGLILKDCTLHEKDSENRWVGLPAKQIDKNGTTSYVNIIEFNDKNDYYAFQRAALEAVDSFTGGVNP